MIFHPLEYAGFALLICRATKAQFPAWLFQKRFLYVLIAVFLYAISDEIHQAFVPYRDAALSDVAADTFGGLVAVILYR